MKFETRKIKKILDELDDMNASYLIITKTEGSDRLALVNATSDGPDLFPVESNSPVWKVPENCEIAIRIDLLRAILSTIETPLVKICIVHDSVMIWPDKSHAETRQRLLGASIKCEVHALEAEDEK